MLPKVVFLLFIAVFQANAGSTGRIVAGADAPTTIKTVVSVQYMSKHVCGGVLYKTNYVITAAQCVYGKEPGAITVRQNSPKHDSGGNICYVSEVHAHPQYDEDLKQNDIAVLKIKEGKTNSDITLPTSDPAGLANQLDAYGWGSTTNQGGGLSTTLKTTKLTHLTNSKCLSELGSLFINTNVMCTSIDKTLGSNTCHGDEGGPLLNSKELLGIFSWNTKCDKGPSVYTNVFRFKDWINSFVE